MLTPADSKSVQYVWLLRYNVYAQYIATTPGWKGNIMSNVDTQILELIQAMTPEQLIKAFDLARAMLETKQEECAFVQETSSVRMS